MCVCTVFYLCSFTSVCEQVIHRNVWLNRNWDDERCFASVAFFLKVIGHKCLFVKIEGALTWRSHLLLGGLAPSCMLDQALGKCH